MVIWGTSAVGVVDDGTSPHADAPSSWRSISASDRCRGCGLRRCVVRALLDCGELSCLECRRSVVSVGPCAMRSFHRSAYPAKTLVLPILADLRWNCHPEQNAIVHVTSSRSALTATGRARRATCHVFQNSTTRALPFPGHEPELPFTLPAVSIRLIESHMKSQLCGWDMSAGVSRIA